MGGPAAPTFRGHHALPELAAALARCRVLVTGDSGLGHWPRPWGCGPGAVRPTVPAFGFGPRLPASRILERELHCRPCSLHGEKPCRYGHQDCLAGLAPAAVLAALAAMGTAP